MNNSIPMNLLFSPITSGHKSIVSISTSCMDRDGSKPHISRKKHVKSCHVSCRISSFLISFLGSAGLENLSPAQVKSVRRLERSQTSCFPNQENYILRIPRPRFCFCSLAFFCLIFFYYSLTMSSEGKLDCFLF